MAHPITIDPGRPIELQIAVTVKAEPSATVMDALHRIEIAIQKLGGTMALDFSKMQAAVEKETTVQQSVLTLISQQNQMIQDLKNSVVDPDAQAKIDDFASQFMAAAQSLADATVKNTPAQ